MKQTFLSFLLMLLPMLASADAVEIGGIWYNLISKLKVAEVTWNPNKYKGNVVIPSTIEYNGVNYTVTSINGGAFTGCRDIISITIPNTVNTIGAEVFDTYSDNIPLYSIYISDLEAWCNMNFLESYYYTLAPYRLFLNGEEVKNLEIPNTINTIKYNSFSNCVSIESVTIPSSITLIEERAFDGCTSLSSVHIADLDSWCRIVIHSNPLATAQHLYMNNEEIKDLIIPNGVTSIGSNLFWGCSGLTSVTIPNSVTSIGEYAFFCCSGLESVHISDLTAWCNIIFDDNPLQYAHHLYLGDNEISDLVIPNSVETIGSSTFSGCKSLTSVTIPNSVTSIGNYAFSGCGLTSVTIGSGVTSIGDRAFANCDNLMDVYCLADNVPSTSSDAFDGSYPQAMTLHVPAASISAYQAIEPWKYFKGIVAVSGGTPPPTPTTKCATPVISYSGGKIEFTCATDGVDFVSSVTSADVNSYTGSTINLTLKFAVSVYATKAGLDNSDEATKDIEIVIGDMDGDGNVNAADVVKLVNKIMNP